jgi:hypothetical protein
MTADQGDPTSNNAPPSSTSEHGSGQDKVSPGAEDPRDVKREPKADEAGESASIRAR